MSEPKCANLITVDSAKSEKKKVTKTTRLDIDLFNSNEKEYPAFNYKELVRIGEGKRNGVTDSEQSSKNVHHGLDPFSDNEEDVERIAKQFEQKYGSASTYGKTKGRSKQDDYADIGAGYDENDSFIDNTDGYDEMIPPEADTAHGGFYINCGALEFTSVPHQQDDTEDPNPIRRNNKRAISSSTSGDESSESLDSESDTTEEPQKSPDLNKETAEIINGNIQHKSLEERKKSKSERRHEKKRHKRVRRVSPDTSGKGAQNKVDVDDVQAVTDGGSADQEVSTDSRTSDSAVSKPAPSSDNVATSESSRDAAVHSGSEEGQSVNAAIPVEVSAYLESIRTLASETRVRNHGVCTSQHMQPRLDHLIKQLDNLLRGCGVDVRRSSWGVAARAVGLGRTRLQKQARLLRTEDPTNTSTSISTTLESEPTASKAVPTVSTATLTMSTTTSTASTSVLPASTAVPSTATVPVAKLDDQQTTQTIMLRLKKIINTMRPSLIRNYNQECQRIHDANKKIAAQNAAMEDDRRIPERRLPKRIFPWNEEVRLLLSELVRSCGASWVAGGSSGAGSREEAAAVFLRDSVLPLFPQGFVRMPTLLQQASLSKDQKIPNSDPSKRHRTEKNYNSPIPKPGNTNSEVENVTPHHLTTSTGAHDKHKSEKSDAPLNSILSTLNLPTNTNVTIEKTSKQPTYNKEDNKTETLEEKKSDKYIPPNSIGCITITPVNNTQRFDSKTSKVVNTVTITASPPKGPEVTEIKGIRVKSPSELMKPANISFSKDDKHKTSLPITNLSSRDDSTKKDKSHTNKHKSTHDKVKHSHISKSPLPESLTSKEKRKSIDNTNAAKTNLKRKVDDPDFVKKKHLKSVNVNETKTKVDNGINSNKTEQNETKRPYVPDKSNQSMNDNFVKPTDKIRPDMNNKNSKIRDDFVKILSDRDPLLEIMDVSDSSSDVELIEEIPPQNHTHSTKANTNLTTKDEKSQKTDVSKKKNEPKAMVKDLGMKENNLDTLVKPNTVPSKTVSVTQTSEKDVDGFVEPISNRSKSRNDTAVAVDSDKTQKNNLTTFSVNLSEGKASEIQKEEDLSDINHYDINKVMQDLKELQKSQEVPEIGDEVFYSRTDKKNHDTFSTPHFDMFIDSSSAENKCEPKSIENSNHSITNG